jgi:NAD(P)-dependent dehydrogenase (short-subunit alcohol dehydrogenase family)
VLSHVYACRLLVPQMLKRGSGYLLSTASAAGLLSSISSAPYTVTKHAAVALAEHMAIQYGDKGIKISVLCPQAVDTNMLRSITATSAGRRRGQPGDCRGLHRRGDGQGAVPDPTAPRGAGLRQAQDLGLGQLAQRHAAPAISSAADDVG